MNNAMDFLRMRTSCIDKIGIGNSRATVRSAARSLLFAGLTFLTAGAGIAAPALDPGTLGALTPRASSGDALGLGPGKRPVGRAIGSDYASLLTQAARLVEGEPTAQQVDAAMARAQAALGRESAFAARLARDGDRLDLAPLLIRDRHRQAVEDFSALATQVRDIVTRAASAHGNGNHFGVTDALRELKLRPRKKPGKKHWRVSQAPAREAARARFELDRQLGRSPLRLAAVSTLSGLALPDGSGLSSPNPDDLVESDETRQSPEIVALAEQLGKHPVRIYNWVRNNIRVVPGYGAAQSARATLAERSGNDADTASLLVALLRASSIPARYVYGTIELTDDQLSAWLDLPAESARDLLSRAGVPLAAVTTSSGHSAVQIEHVWAMAWTDFAPSRGAANRAGNAWVVMDPSFKRSQEAEPSIFAGMGFNEQGVIDNALQFAVCTETSAQGVSAQAIASGFEDFQAMAAQAIAATGTTALVGDLIGRATILAENYNSLMGTLPYRTVAETAAFAALPNPLKWALRVRVYADESARAAGQSVLAYEQSFAHAADSRLSLAFVPETGDDAAALELYLPEPHADGSPIEPHEYPSEVPAYLIQVRAEIRQGGQLVDSGGSFVLGTPLQLVTELYDPSTQSWVAGDDGVIAGETHAFGLDPRGALSARLTEIADRTDALRAHIEAGNGGALAAEEITGELFGAAILNYFALLDAGAEFTHRAGGPREVRLPSFGRATAKLEPVSVLNLIARVRFPGLVLEVDHLAAATPGDTRALATRQGLQRASTSAHQVLERVFGAGTMQGVSAVSALSAAQAAGQSLVWADELHADALEAVQSGADVLEAARDAVNAGQRVLVNPSPALLGGWVGDALATEDAATGSGRYLVSTGQDDAGLATGLLYNGQGWLSLVQPSQAGTATLDALDGAGLLSLVSGALLADASATHWSAFPAKDDLLRNLYVARLTQAAATPATQACVWLAGAMAAELGGGLAGADPFRNHAPVILSTPSTLAKAELSYQYQIQATDLDQDVLSYRLVTSPVGMTISETGLVQWTTALPGSHAVRIQVDDGKAVAEQSWLLTVGDADAPLQLSLAVQPMFAAAGETVSVTVEVAGGTNAGVPTLQVGGQALALDANGQASFAAAASGTHRIVATVSDERGTLSRESQYAVIDPADTTAPQALISSPEADAEVTDVVTIGGTASDANFAYYRLLYRPSGAPDNAWLEFERAIAPVTDGVLGSFDPTVLDNGLYQIALQVVDVNGQSTVATLSVEVTRDLKIGPFSVSFEDLSIEASGIPIRVTRSYSTLRRNDALDFGFGWSVGYQDVQLRKNMVLGLAWNVESEGLNLCLRPAGKRKVSITLPGGEVARFIARNETDCGFFQVPPIATVFDPLAGTTARLEVINVPLLLAQGGQLYDVDNFGPWNPTDFKLTTEEGIQYYLKGRRRHHPGEGSIRQHTHLRCQRHPA